MELTLKRYLAWIDRFADQVIAQKDYLSELDAKIGDGDHGNNLARGVEAIKNSLTKEPQDLTTALKLTAMALISKVGGAAGPLYGTAFLEMAKTSSRTADLGQLLAAATTGLQKRGGAKAGDKTMVDVWLPVSAAVTKGKLTTDVIEKAVSATKPMEAKKGRASYLGERSIGHLDPGAVSSGYLFDTLIKTEDSK